MKIEWMAHACFLLESESGVRVVTDPYQSGAFDNALRYGPVDLEAEIVTASHDHDDHFDPLAVKGTPLVLREAGGETEHKGVKVTGVATDHDPTGGSERGHNVVFRIEMDGLSILHLGDLGHVPTAEQVERMGSADILLVPVGGHFTIGAEEAKEVIELLFPKVVIPMHFKTSKVDFPIAGVDDFLSIVTGAKPVGSPAVVVSRTTLPPQRECWVLEPTR
ncbi:MAG: MBL fold metallo-hydrolase [Planctomycetota bacterium]|jgi:L-ascorbate metabolism protein UlaG (beta-lactamase superfamily)